MNTRYLENEFTVYPLQVLEDNITWILVYENQAIIVDPSLAFPVINWLNLNKIEPCAILQTHHHIDHIGGTPELIKNWPKIKVLAASSDKERIPFQNISVKEGDSINLIGFDIQILEVPGHTNNHISFYIENHSSNKAILFCGDTLFSAGCGRIFEGTFSDMFFSLNKLNSLPSHTKIFCGHEYTLSNLKWAKKLRPNNRELVSYHEKIQTLRINNQFSLPTSIESERKFNLFLQAKNIEEFKYLRIHKDNWNM